MRALEKMIVSPLLPFILTPTLCLASTSLEANSRCSKPSIDSLTAEDVFTQIRYSAGEISRKQAGTSQLKLFEIKRLCGVVSIRDYCERAPALASVVAATEFDEFVFKRSSEEKVARAQNREKWISGLCTRAAFYNY